MNRKSRLAVIATLLVCIALVNWSIFQKEHQLSDGTAVYLRLAPVDPRSLMQGDFMALRFEIANEINAAIRQTTDTTNVDFDQSARDGKVLVALDENRVGEFVGLYTGQAMESNYVLLQFRVRHGTVKFATNAFFFQEGQAEIYESAAYGLFRVADDGHVLLASLHDNTLKRLGSESNH